MSAKKKKEKLRVVKQWPLEEEKVKIKYLRFFKAQIAEKQCHRNALVKSDYSIFRSVKRIQIENKMLIYVNKRISAYDYAIFSILQIKQRIKVTTHFQNGLGIEKGCPSSENGQYVVTRWLPWTLSPSLIDFIPTPRLTGHVTRVLKWRIWKSFSQRERREESWVREILWTPLMNIKEIFTRTNTRFPELFSHPKGQWKEAPLSSPTNLDRYLQKYFPVTFHLSWSNRTEHNVCKLYLVRINKTTDPPKK